MTSRKIMVKFQDSKRANIASSEQKLCNGWYFPFIVWFYFCSLKSTYFTCKCLLIIFNKWINNKMSANLTHLLYFEIWFLTYFNYLFFLLKIWCWSMGWHNGSLYQKQTKKSINWAHLEIISIALLNIQNAISHLNTMVGHGGKTGWSNRSITYSQTHSSTWIHLIPH